MINVIGLGNAGCKIADLLAQHPPYEIYKIDADLPKEKNSFSIGAHGDAQEYEEQIPPSVTKALQQIEGRVLFVVGGGGKISSATLRLLECVRDTQIEVLYIRPDLSHATPLVQTLDRITFNVLQQYARSGVFERLYIISNSEIEKVVGSLPVSQYYAHINSTIVSTFHMLNVYKNTAPNFSRFLEEDTISRICTIGVGTMNKVVDEMFFPLEHIQQKTYYFAINEEQVDGDGELLSNIKRRIATGGAPIETGFGVYSTPYKDNYIYVVANTKIIQGVNYDE